MIDYKTIRLHLQEILKRMLVKSAPPGEIPVVKWVYNQKTGSHYPVTYYTNPNQSKPSHSGKTKPNINLPPMSQYIMGESQPPRTSSYPGSFRTEEDAEKVLGAPGDATGELEKWYKQINEDHKNAIKQYTGMWYRTMNGLNRKTIKPSTISPQDLSRVRRWAKLIEEAISKYVLKQDIVVHRQVNQDMLPLLQKSFQSPDKLFIEPGFFSTTPIIDSFKRSNTIDIVIKVPKGKGRGAWIKYLSKYPKEREFLINSYSTFTVDSIQKINGKWKVEMTWVGRMETNP